MEEEVLFKPVLGRKENVRYFETPQTTRDHNALGVEKESSFVAEPHQRPQCFIGRRVIGYAASHKAQELSKIITGRF